MTSKSSMVENVGFTARISFVTTSQLILRYFVVQSHSCGHLEFRRCHVTYLNISTCSFTHLSIPHKTLFTACRYLSPFSSGVTYTAWGIFYPPPVAGIRCKKKKPSSAWGLTFLNQAFHNVGLDVLPIFLPNHSNVQWFVHVSNFRVRNESALDCMPKAPGTLQNKCASAYLAHICLCQQFKDCMR